MHMHGRAQPATSPPFCFLHFLPSFLICSQICARVRERAYTRPLCHTCPLRVTPSIALVAHPSPPLQSLTVPTVSETEKKNLCYSFRVRRLFPPHAAIDFGEARLQLRRVYSTFHSHKTIITFFPPPPLPPLPLSSSVGCFPAVAVPSFALPPPASDFVRTVPLGRPLQVVGRKTRGGH